MTKTKKQYYSRKKLPNKGFKSLKRLFNITKKKRKKSKITKTILSNEFNF